MNAIVPASEIRSRLPMPRDLAVKDDIDARKWRVLCETTFPNAKSPEAVLMAIDYCRARGLDVFKKPVHIVPMWNSSLGREVETVWPGINEVQITAARTGAWAGMDEPRWGDAQEVTFKGRKKVKGSWVDAEAKVAFPEWCVVTVYRMVGGAPRAFAEPVYWLEAYSRAGGSELPTDMWIKRPRGQLHKVAKAASLRAAFPEEGEYTAEEMEGKEIEAGGIVVEHEPTTTSPKRTREQISAEANRKRQELRDVEADVLQINSIPELDRFVRDVLTPDFMAGLGMKQYAAEEFVARRRMELQREEPSEPATEEPEDERPNAKADYVQHCHAIIEQAEDEKALLGWWNSRESKDKRREHDLSKEEVQALMARVAEKREQLVGTIPAG